jgi:hypothetical protein
VCGRVPRAHAAVFGRLALMCTQEVAKLQARVSSLESQLVEAKASIADNKLWVERLKPCLEWKGRIEALEASSSKVLPIPSAHFSLLTVRSGGASTHADPHARLLPAPAAMFCLSRALA